MARRLCEKNIVDAALKLFGNDCGYKAGYFTDHWELSRTVPPNHTTTERYIVTHAQLADQDAKVCDGFAFSLSPTPSILSPAERAKRKAELEKELAELKRQEEEEAKRLREERYNIVLQNIDVFLLLVSHECMRGSDEEPGDGHRCARCALLNFKREGYWPETATLEITVQYPHPSKSNPYSGERY